jgi:hypothetical protein
MEHLLFEPAIRLPRTAVRMNNERLPGEYCHPTGPAGVGLIRNVMPCPVSRAILKACWHNYTTSNIGETHRSIRFPSPWIPWWHWWPFEGQPWPILSSASPESWCIGWWGHQGPFYRQPRLQMFQQHVSPAHSAELVYHWRGLREQLK